MRTRNEFSTIEVVADWNEVVKRQGRTKEQEYKWAQRLRVGREKSDRTTGKGEKGRGCQPAMNLGNIATSKDC